MGEPGDSTEVNDVQEAPQRLTRRELMKRAAIVGGVAVWGVPLVRMALDDGDKGVSVRTANVSSEGPEVAAFPETCENVPLGTPDVSRLVCAKNARNAESAFRSVVKTECAALCGTSTACGSGSCRGAKRTPTTITNLVCTETGNAAGCPQELYGRGLKEFVCTAVVTCHCECR